MTRRYVKHRDTSLSNWRVEPMDVVLARLHALTPYPSHGYHAAYSGYERARYADLTLFKAARVKADALIARRMEAQDE